MPLSPTPPNGSDKTETRGCHFAHSLSLHIQILFAKVARNLAFDTMYKKYSVTYIHIQYFLHPEWIKSLNLSTFRKKY